MRERNPPNSLYTWVGCVLYIVSPLSVENKSILQTDTLREIDQSGIKYHSSHISGVITVPNTTIERYITWTVKASYLCDMEWHKLYWSVALHLLALSLPFISDLFSSPFLFLYLRVYLYRCLRLNCFGNLWVITSKYPAQFNLFELSFKSARALKTSFNTFCLRYSAKTSPYCNPSLSNPSGSALYSVPDIR